MVELIKNFYYIIDHHPSRENVVDDAFSRKNKVVVEALEGRDV
jgi:hypothetical protein